LSTMQPKRLPPSKQRFDPPQIQPDKRIEQRIISHAPLIFTPFSSRFHREYASMTFNHSRSGLCMESAKPFKYGSVLYIRLSTTALDHLYQVNRQYLRTSTLGEVMWCREQQNKLGTRYRIGVKYI
jgi:hypothetical protein